MIDVRKPAFVERAPAWLHGGPTQRLIVILRASGCAWGRRRGGGCTNCGFDKLTTHGTPVAAADLVAQFDAALAQGMDGVGEVDIYNSGSFFSDGEVPPRARTEILSRLAPTSVRRVLVESRPEFIRPEAVAQARAALGDRELEVGVGLESADDRVRDELVNKGFGKAEFERAVAVLGAQHALLLVYVLVKPLGLGEREAIEDSVATARYVFEVSRRLGVPARIALEPVFVAEGTVVEREFLAGRYRPPSLWSAVEIVRRVHPLGEALVGLSDEGLEPRRAADGCQECGARLRLAIAAYNRSRDLASLDAVHCPACEARSALARSRDGEHATGQAGTGRGAMA
jgi:radical SAM enzyme (TIGR01210 family)